jgi:glutamate-1-semialdehyde 2,1-aminomutase
MVLTTDTATLFWFQPAQVWQPLLLPAVPYSDTVANNTLVVPYNDVKALENALKSIKNQIACVITEPVCGNMGVVLPQKNYLASLRKLCTQHNALLIFDEVMTGFRAVLAE